MRKVYIVPQTEAMQFSSEIIMDSISIVHHSGGRTSGGGGFDDPEDIW